MALQQKEPETGQWAPSSPSVEIKLRLQVTGLGLTRALSTRSSAGPSSNRGTPVPVLLQRSRSATPAGPLPPARVQLLLTPRWCGLLERPGPRVWVTLIESSYLLQEDWADHPTRRRVVKRETVSRTVKRKRKVSVVGRETLVDMPQPSEGAEEGAAMGRRAGRMAVLREKCSGRWALHSFCAGPQAGLGVLELVQLHVR